MANEITAEMLAEWIAENIGGDPRAWSQDARSFLTLTRAHAALMAEMAEPEKVRCWANLRYDEITLDADDAHYWRNLGHVVTPGWFTPDTEVQK